MTNSTPTKPSLDHKLKSPAHHLLSRNSSASSLSFGVSPALPVPPRLSVEADKAAGSGVSSSRSSSYDLKGLSEAQFKTSHAGNDSGSIRKGKGGGISLANSDADDDEIDPSLKASSSSSRNSINIAVSTLGTGADDASSSLLTSSETATMSSSLPMAGSMSIPHSTEAGDPDLFLREKLRQTLNRSGGRRSRSGTTASRKGKEKEVNVSNPSLGAILDSNFFSGDTHCESGATTPSLVASTSLQSKRLPRKYFILTSAGKPVYSTTSPATPPSTQTSSEEEESRLNTTVGVIQALVSIFADEVTSGPTTGGDKLRSISSGPTKIVFLLRPPLYFACVSEGWDEPESVLRTHLEYLHLQIQSILTGAQLTKIFEKRTNFDLRRLLEGTDSIFQTLLDRLQWDFGLLTNCLEPMRCPADLREKAGEALIPSMKIKDLLYVLLLSPTLLPINLLRPRKHSIHPTDLQLLLNTIRASSSLLNPDTSNFIPICLPRFSSSGFLHAYISVLSSGLIVLFVGADRTGIEIMKEGKDEVEKRLVHALVGQRLVDEADSSKDGYGVEDTGVDGLKHFIYRSCVNVQVTRPRWGNGYDDIDDQRRLFTHYQTLHDALHSRSYSGADPLSFIFIKTPQESILGWFTQPFEMYLSLSPTMTKSAAISAANKLARWVRKEEPRLWLRDAPVF